MTPSLLTCSRRGTIGLARLDLAELVHPEELARLSHEFRQWAAVEELAAYVLDLSQLTYMTSASIGMLLNMDAHLKARGLRFAVVASSGLIGEIVRHTHLNEVFPVYASADEAVTALA